MLATMLLFANAVYAIYCGSVTRLIWSTAALGVCCAVMRAASFRPHEKNRSLFGHNTDEGTD